MKATAKIKRCGFGRIGRQANRLELHTGMFQQLLHQCFSDIATAYGGRNVHAAESSRALRCIGVTVKAADCDQLPFTKYAQQALARLVESVGVVVPLGNQARQESETFGDRLGLQHADLRWKSFEFAYRRKAVLAFSGVAVVGGSHANSALDKYPRDYNPENPEDQMR